MCEKQSKKPQSSVCLHMQRSERPGCIPGISQLPEHVNDILRLLFLGFLSLLIQFQLQKHVKQTDELLEGLSGSSLLAQTKQRNPLVQVEEIKISFLPSVRLRSPEEVCCWWSP